MVEEPNRIPIENLNIPAESRIYAETRRYSETGTYRETQTYTEKGPLDASPEAKRNEERKRTKSRSHLLASTLVVAAVVVLGVVPNPIYDSIFDPMFGPPNAGGDDADIGLSGNFTSFDVTDSTVRYFFSLEGWEDGDQCSVTLENKFTERTQTFEGGALTGIERDLRPGMTYTLTLSSGSTVLDTATVTTEREHEVHFYLADAHCTCPVDGMFHLTVDVVDDEGVWTHLRVELADRYGGVSVITVTDYAAEQEIPVTSAGLRGDSAELRIYAVSEDGGVDLLYRGDHMI